MIRIFNFSKSVKMNELIPIKSFLKVEFILSLTAVMWLQ